MSLYIKGNYSDEGQASPVDDAPMKNAALGVKRGESCPMKALVIVLIPAAAVILYALFVLVSAWIGGGL